MGRVILEGMECVESVKKQEVLGRLKIVLVETPPSEMLRREWVAALVMIAYYLMGIINVSTTYYTLLWWRPPTNHAHVLLCSSGMMLLTPTAILFYNRLGSVGSVLEPDDRMISHGILHAVSFAFIAVGAAIVFATMKISSDAHTIVSSLALLGILGNILLGVRMTRGSRQDPGKYKMHRYFGVLTLWACAASFITGTFKIGPIIGWIPLLPRFIYDLLAPLKGFRYFLIVPCVLITLITSGHPLLRSYF